MIYLGVDFGTTNSCIYIARNEHEDPKPMLANGGGIPVMPSVICEKVENGESKQYFGTEALEKADKDTILFTNLKLSLRDKANRGKFKSKTGWQYYHNGIPLKGDEYNKKQLVSKFIKQLFEEAGIVDGENGTIIWKDGQSAAKTYVKITMGYPIFKDSEQKNAYLAFFKDVLENIGFAEENISFTIEPGLAAFGLARGADKDISSGDRILIFDCGGGTTDVSILERQNDESYRVIDSDGCNYAGVAIDKALFRFMRKNAQQSYTKSFVDNVFNGKTDINVAYLSTIRKLKEDACLAPHNKIIVNDLDYAKELGISGGRDFLFKEFYESEFWKDVIKKILQPLYAVIERANPENTGCKIKKFYLAGGSSAMPKIRNELEKILKEHQ